MTGRDLILWSPYPRTPWELAYCMRVANVEFTYVYLTDKPPPQYTHFAVVDCHPEPPEPTRHQFRP